MAQRNRDMMERADRAMAASVDDTELLRVLRSMQIQALVTQTLVAGSSADEPANVKLDLKKVFKDYSAAQAKLAHLTTERRMTTLGGITDLPHRVQIARQSFEELEEKAVAAVDQGAKAGGIVPAAAMLQISARVDGLYEHLDRMVEGAEVMAAKDKTELAEVLSHNGATMTTFSRITTGATAFGAILSIMVALFMWRGILTPLLAITRATRKLGGGDLGVTIPRVRATEIAEMTGALAIFRDNARTAERLRDEAEGQERRHQTERRQALHSIAGTLEADVGSVATAVTQAVEALEGSAKSMSDAVAVTEAKAAAVASAARSALNHVHKVAEASQVMSASIGEILSQNHRSRIVEERLDTEAKRVSAQIHELSANVAGIDDVTKLIDDLAGRTNLLALNATIESARAGEAGKGFAVVAGEVKTLATQTAKATGAIAAKIASIMAGTAEAVAAIDTVAAVLVEMRGIGSAVTQAVEHQTTATQDIAQSVEEAASAASAVAETIAGVEVATDKTGKAARSVDDAAASLSHQTGILREGLSQFLSQIRSNAA